MTLEEIKKAVDSGKKVYWNTPAYQVIKDSKNQYLITFLYGDDCCGLTWQDGKTLNGEPEEFFTEDDLNHKVGITKYIKDAEVHFTPDGETEFEIYINGWYLCNVKKENVSEQILNLLEG